MKALLTAAALSLPLPLLAQAPDAFESVDAKSALDSARKAANGMPSLKEREASSPPAPAAPPAGEVFRGSSRWTSNSNFSPLERLGVQASAEDRALQTCQAAGYLNCVIAGSVIDKCHYGECRASGVARELAVSSGAELSTLKKTSSWKKTSGSHFSALEQLGVHKAARMEAVKSCQERGLLDCVVLTSSIAACDSYSCSADAIARGRK